MLLAALPAFLAFAPSVNIGRSVAQPSPLPSLRSSHIRTTMQPRNGDILLHGGGSGGNGGGGGSEDSWPFGGDEDDEGWEGTSPRLLVTAITVMIIFGRRGGGDAAGADSSSGKSVFQQIRDQRQARQAQK